MSTYKTIHVLCILVIALLIVRLNSLAINTTSEVVLLKRNVDKSESFKCSIPESQCISLYDFIQENIPHQKNLPNPDALVSITPPCAVVNRCTEDIGCCGDSGKQCTRLNSHSIPIVFKALDVDEMKYIYISLSVQNDTSCACN